MSASVTRHRCHPRRHTRRSATPAPRGRVGVRPLVNLEEETPRDVKEYELDSFENQLEPTCQADMFHVIYIDKDDPNPELPCAFRLDLAELIELARRKRIEHCLANVRRPRKDVWLGPVPAEARDRQRTLLHNMRHALVAFPCNMGDMPPVSNGMVPLTGGERPYWLSPTSVFTSCSVMILCTRLSLD